MSSGLIRIAMVGSAPWGRVHVGAAPDHRPGEAADSDAPSPGAFGDGGAIVTEALGRAMSKRPPQLGDSVGGLC
jgi:hypothetical protein